MLFRFLYPPWMLAKSCLPSRRSDCRNEHGKNPACEACGLLPVSVATLRISVADVVSLGGAAPFKWSVAEAATCRAACIIVLSTELRLDEHFMS